MATVSCPRCNESNPPGVRFCASCGNPLGAQLACTQCGAALIPNAAFCGECGAGTGQPEIPPGPGSVVGGEWDKGQDELVRLVSEREMRGQLFDPGTNTGGTGFWAFLRSAGRTVLDAIQGRTIRVPTGCVAAVMVDGQVRSMLPPGQQTTIGFFQGITNIIPGSNEQGRTQFYLVDRQPVPVHLQVEVPASQPGQALTLGITVTTHVVSGVGDAARDALTIFLNQVVADRDMLTVRDLRSRVRPIVERAARDSARSYKPGETDLSSMTTRIREVLDQELGRSCGLRFDVLVAPRAAVISLDLHLGRVATPDIEPCVFTTCNGELRFGAGYCPDCGKRQPTRQEPDRRCQGKLDDGSKCAAKVPVGSQFCKECGTAFDEPSAEAGRLISSDGELVELDLVLRAQGQRELDDPTAIEAAIADAVSRIVRGMTYDELATPDGFRQIGVAVEAVAEDVLRAMQLTLLDLTVLDCKSKTGEWVMAARSELNRARTELGVNREWLDLDGDRITLDGERVTLDGQKIDVEQLALEMSLRRTRMQLDMEFHRMEVLRADALRDLKAETEHARNVDEVGLEDREARQDIEGRSANLDVADANRDANRDLSVDEAQRRRERGGRDRDHEDQLSAADQGHARDVQAVDQSQELDDRVDAQRRKRDADELGHQIDLEERTAEHGEKQARRDLGLRREELDLRLDESSRSQDINLQGDRGRMEIDQDGKDRDHGRSVDLLKLEQENEAAERAQQVEVLKQKAEAERERIAADAAAKAQVNASLAGMSAEQMMAASMQARELSDAEAAALAEAASGGDREARALMERMMAERLADRDAHSSQMMAMFQQTLQATQANSAAQSEAQAQGHKAVVAAHKDGQEQARSMAEQSMNAMSRVAASRATPEAPTTRICVKPGCGGTIEPDKKFCMHCGTPQGA